MIVATWLGCGGSFPEPPLPPPSPARAAPAGVGGNVLLIMADDVGPMNLAAYGVHPSQPPTPTIDRLASEGVRFENAWGFPLCSPARAATLTGRWPTRTGFNTYIAPDGTWSLPLREVTLPEMLRASPRGYTSALVGKWHVGSYTYAAPEHHPLDQGFDRFLGSFENLTGALHPDGRAVGYGHWERIVDGRAAMVDTYATTTSVDDALTLMAELPEPWFIELAFNAAHYPAHIAPPGLSTLSADVTLDCQLAIAQCFRTALEAMDHELGRLLDSADAEQMARTTVIFTADNGVDGRNITPPFDRNRCKATAYDGGVRVPLIVTGPVVERPGTSSEALVSLVDVFPTVAELADVPPTALPAIDGVPFLDNVRDPDAAGARTLLFAQMAEQNGPPPWTGMRVAVRDAEWKLMRTRDGEVEQLFHYGPDQIDEGPAIEDGELAGAAEARARLGAELDRWLADAAFEVGP